MKYLYSSIEFLTLKGQHGATVRARIQTKKIILNTQSSLLLQRFKLKQFTNTIPSESISEVFRT